MTQKISLLTLSIAATATLASERFVSANGEHAAAKGHALGVTTTTAKVGTLVGVDVLGTAVVQAGGVIARGESVQVGPDGQAVKQTDGKTVGVALQPATAAGDRIEVLLIPNAAQA